MVSASSGCKVAFASSPLSDVFSNSYLLRTIKDPDHLRYKQGMQARLHTFLSTTFCRRQ